MINGNEKGTFMRHEQQQCSKGFITLLGLWVLQAKIAWKSANEHEKKST